MLRGIGIPFRLFWRHKVGRFSGLNPADQRDPECPAMLELAPWRVPKTEPGSNTEFQEKPKAPQKKVAGMVKASKTSYDRIGARFVSSRLVPCRTPHTPRWLPKNSPWSGERKPCQHRNKTTAFSPVLTPAVAAPSGGPERPCCAGERQALIFSVDPNRKLPQHGSRSAKRRRLLESNAKEYPAGLIADDGLAQVTAPESKHIGPIDPDASTLKQFLKSLAHRATADVLVDGGEARLRSLRTAAPTKHRPGQKRQFPIAGRGDQERDAGSPTRRIRQCSCPS